MFYVYVQNKLVITTDTKDIAKKIAIQHGFKNFEITETKKADDNANENGYFLEPVKNGFKICAPAQKSDDEVALEELEQQESTLNAQIAELKDQLLTATLADDTEQVAAIKAEYQNLVGV